MKAAQRLHNNGQSIWLDNVTRTLLDSGTLEKYIDEFAVSGLTSKPTIFDHAIRNGIAYDAAICEKLQNGKSGEVLFFELALEDLSRAAEPKCSRSPSFRSSRNRPNPCRITTAQPIPSSGGTASLRSRNDDIQ
jgi:hypothetical protein